MFDKPVDIVEMYGALPPNIKKKSVLDEKPIKLKDRKLAKNTKRKYYNSHETYLAYQELRKTDRFKKWWKRQYYCQDGLCYYCKINLRNVDINVEHITPMSAGGSNKYKNLVLSCSRCNKEKGSSLLSSRKRKALDKELKERMKINKTIYEEAKKTFNFQNELDRYWRDNI